jgi:hypothetical protein
MAIVSTRPAVLTTATLIASNVLADAASIQESHDYAVRSFLVKNFTGTASVFIGGSDVTAASPAFEWTTTDGPLTVDLEPGEELYGIVAATTQTLHVLRQGR